MVVRARVHARALSFPPMGELQTTTKGLWYGPLPDAVHRSDAHLRTPLTKPDTMEALGWIKSGWLCLCVRARVSKWVSKMGVSV